MAITGSSKFSLAGASSVSRPRCAQDHPDAPLMYAIGFALGAGDCLDSYMHGIFPPYSTHSLGGGDPGWLWYHEKKADGKDVVVVEITDVIAPPNGIWNEYSEEKMRYEIRAALSNFALQNPDRLTEVDTTIRKFNLVDIQPVDDLMLIPHWDGTLPQYQILNEMSYSGMP